jgi:antitoxin MazE
MRARIVRIGNSRGIRIPKPLLEQAGLGGDEVELSVEGRRIVIAPAHRARAGWAEAFAGMHGAGDDRLLDEDVPTRFDEEEWEWG